MGKWRKRIRVGCLSMLVLFIVLTQVVSGCVSFSMSDKEVEEYFEEEPNKPVSKFYDVDGYTMHYMYQDMDKEGSLVFIHGTPGSWDAFISYFKSDTLIERANIVSPDRPGFGKSSYGKPIKSLKEQSRLLKPMLEAIPAPRILIGHSLGGPIVARMAMDYPELVDGIIMLAPALDPALEPNEDWFRIPMRWPVIGAIAPKIFRISNEELVFLDEELEYMLPLWKDITIPSVVVQGAKDKLVHPGNAAFADSMLVSAPKDIVFLEESNHFLPWNKGALIRRKIVEMLNQIKSDSLR
ncbi:alpha/beta fold hydrolase [Roseivirga sp. E12]|uniref:alpha/beta fold hydrolase n=1 Tax=Roseivirga sp. E12 TaxID=2819237 RepID=UPI001ABC8923|nr:alpha/beta hydrolase [Roseivirga sp. E12]MBO3696856.1 alpha/beta hydrolase [Roseivirga sp. E12]